MRVLVLNWRDIRNPKSGGAEILTHELAKRLVKNNHEVLQFSSEFPNSKKSEIVDGIKIIRDGNPDARTLFSSVHYKAYKYYKKELVGKVDLVIDEVHGIPFFTPLYVREEKAALICEVAGALWDKAVKFPFNIFGKTIESIYPKFYKNVPIITISESSKKELIELGFPSKNTNVIHLGSDAPIVKALPVKNKVPTIIFVGRLTKAKGIEDALKTVALLKEKFSDIILWVIGRGEDDYLSSLHKMIDDLQIKNNVKFWGFIDNSLRNDLLGKAHVLISPSAKEGWGLTVHEAGARGTPAVVYNVEGLREVLVDGKNGFLCKKNTPQEMTRLVESLLLDKKLYSKMQQGAIQEREKFSWENTYKEFISFLKIK